MFKMLQFKLILFFLSIPNTSVYAQKSIKFITENWPPYNYVEDNKLKGFSTEIVRLVMKELKIDEHIEVFPSMRARKVLDSSKRTILFSFIRTKERENHYKWIGPFGSQSIHFYKRKDSPFDIQNLEDAKKVESICCRNGGLVFNKLTKMGFKNLDKSTSAKSIYLKAIVGRCDLAISETPSGFNYWMNELKRPKDALVQTPAKITSTPLYIVATKDFSDKEIADWQAALDRVISSKKYLEIAKKYHQEN